jgi:hypothetical protein
MVSPRDDLQSLPQGVEALRALVLATMSERDAAVTERDTLLAQNDRLRPIGIDKPAAPPITGPAC